MFDLNTLADFPPFIVRMMARRPTPGVQAKCVQAKTNAEIAKESGLPVKRVNWIAAQKDWDKVPVGEAASFAAACGFQYGKTWKQRWFLHRTFKLKGGLRYLEKLPAKERHRVVENIDKNWDKWLHEYKARRNIPPG